MKEAMKNYEDAVNDVMNACKGVLGEFVLEEDMDERALDMLKKSFKLVTASMELMKAQNEMLIQANEKLDKLVNKD
jgi:hypothetical protein